MTQTQIEEMLAAGDLVDDRQNRRVKLHLYDRARLKEYDQMLRQVAEKSNATKLIVYGKKRDVAEWLALGYRQEGVIDGFFRGENAYMLTAYVTEERATSTAPELAEEILALSLAKAGAGEEKPLPEGYSMRPATEADAEELARLYGLVFATYPTPMDDPHYVRKTMQEGTVYFVVEHAGKIACAASAEVSERMGSAEMTDCATHPDHAGKGLLQPLFCALEKKMEEAGIYYLYTLTRAQSAGMNVTAAKMGYEYRGRLINNCTIFSGFEDMNIWVKPLRQTRDE
ncbi:putative beta-lysine N-acetyltransferase [Brevibacillus agri]|uniref:Beta-lysine N-acetyltransferase n=1 Tax=Brevibacillus agri TaxID=51101 RepID=A0A3M8B4W8_9BACL|nr:MULTISPECIES: putative beta-lysine N-acetyltransferase [Brevibacillus]MED1645244.1 putative beta-lysine N-acetyltransferase [Brevibacillus agri]MED1657303.1 putative beta-lysine N-acetyltransferase [Brevibacillus agri]MED1688770.1 putative beta-lysine N-acetyltransferase [Brevibacillus agri]MED1694401.1 putative beta-lysine N-acetyltransferase [Brevibacillus agri]MED1697650.1 putative beta-lysine N-acetyltransferase [Brevibacillus agri]